AARPDNFYAIFFPPWMQVTMDGMASCSQFCGYHSYFLYGGQQIKYVVVPYLDCASCNFAGTSVADRLTTVMSHEIRETVTDADVLHGWWDSATGYEADDKCNGVHVYQMFNGGFWVQPEWSNGGTVTASGFTATYPGPGCVVPSSRVTAPSFTSQPLNWFIS